MRKKKNIITNLVETSKIGFAGILAGIFCLIFALVYTLVHHARRESK